MAPFMIRMPTSRLLRVYDLNVTASLPCVRVPTLVLHCRVDKAIPLELGVPDLGLTARNSTNDRCPSYDARRQLRVSRRAPGTLAQPLAV